MLVTFTKDYGDYKVGQSVTLLVPEAKQMISSGYAAPYVG